MNNWTLQKKWTYSAAISIFISFLAMCIILYFSIFNWMLISEKKIAQNTLNEVVGFFESRGPIISIQDIQRNKTLLNQLVNQEQSVRILNSDGIEILRINDASDFPNFSSEVAFEFELQNINNKLLYHNTAADRFWILCWLFRNISQSTKFFAINELYINSYDYFRVNRISPFSFYWVFIVFHIVKTFKRTS